MTAGKQTIMVLDIRQRFQTFEGSASIEGRSAVHNGRIRGDKISFSVDGQTYRGTVCGNTIEGEGGAARAAPWRATRTAG
jgi:hypothetical protein